MLSINNQFEGVKIKCKRNNKGVEIVKNNVYQELMKLKKVQSEVLIAVK